MMLTCAPMASYACRKTCSGITLGPQAVTDILLACPWYRIGYRNSFVWALQLDGLGGLLLIAFGSYMFLTDVASGFTHSLRLQASENSGPTLPTFIPQRDNVRNRGILIYAPTHNVTLASHHAQSSCQINFIYLSFCL